MLRTDPVLESLAAKEREDDAQDKRDEYMERRALDEIKMVRSGFGPDVLDSDEIAETALERRYHREMVNALSHLLATNRTEEIRDVLADVVDEMTQNKDWQDKVDRKGPE